MQRKLQTYGLWAGIGPLKDPTGPTVMVFESKTFKGFWRSYSRNTDNDVIKVVV